MLPATIAEIRCELVSVAAADIDENNESCLMSQDTDK